MREFDISYDEVESIAKELRSKADKMQSILEEVTAKVNNVQNNAWQSETAQMYITEYNTLKGKYASFYDKVKTCADFLDNAVRSGREIDLGVQKQVN